MINMIGRTKLSEATNVVWKSTNLFLASLLIYSCYLEILKSCLDPLSPRLRVTHWLSQYDAELLVPFVIQIQSDRYHEK